MVLLGEPGAGKTVAATHLVLGLLDTRRDLADARRAEEPVPVRFNAAGWDGTEDFSQWLITRLGYDYRLRPPIARALIEAGLILPVLDGLDEMDPEHTDDPKARAALDRLNETPWKHRPVVVVCRTSEFEELTRRGRDNGLHGATTLSLKAFAPNQIQDYLRTYQQSIGATAPAWDAVTSDLVDQRDGPLAQALQTPWILALAANALHHDPDTTAQLLDCADADAVRDLLFAAQIPAAIAGTDRTGPYRDYTSDTVRKWLLSLARCLDHRRDTGRNGTAIRLDQIWEIAGTTRTRLLHGLASGLAVGLASGLTFGLAFGLASGITGGLVGGLTFGLAFGLAVGFISGLEMDDSAERVVWGVPGRSRWRGGLAVGLAVGLLGALMIGLLGALMVGLMGGLMSPLRSGLVAGPAVGLAMGLTFGLEFGLSVSEKDKLRISVDETRLIRGDLQAAALSSGCSAFMGGLAAGLGFGLTGPLAGELTVGLAAGLSGGLACAVAFGLLTGTASMRYCIAVLVFRFAATFPPQPRLFLDWARRSGLLRVTGTAYQFRHETYRLWLQQSAQVAKGPENNEQG
ncbi:hypothetical protein ABZ942_14185 [Nocardia sp. NPDC046473]|uniref:NACHT domain-containing protein n=1 Tax=Nocardia sp. NPDC046473 TaxID=3155733 RepID=UPI003404B108